MAFGPVQMLVLGFEEPDFTGEILAELQRLKEAEVVRLVDAIALAKDEEGNVVVLRQSDLDLDEAMELGAIVGGLIGLGEAGEEGLVAGAEAGAEALADGHLFGDEEVWYAADVIPNGSAAAVLLIEHRWAIPLRDAIVRAGGVALADEWIHAKDLVAAGLVAAAEASDAAA